MNNLNYDKIVFIRHGLSVANQNPDVWLTATTEDEIPLYSEDDTFETLEKLPFFLDSRYPEWEPSFHVSPQLRALQTMACLLRAEHPAIFGIRSVILNPGLQEFQSFVDPKFKTPVHVGYLGNPNILSETLIPKMGDTKPANGSLYADWLQNIGSNVSKITPEGVRYPFNFHYALPTAYLSPRVPPSVNDTLSLANGGYAVAHHHSILAHLAYLTFLHGTVRLDIDLTIDYLEEHCTVSSQLRQKLISESCSSLDKLELALEKLTNYPWIRFHDWGTFISTPESCKILREIHSCSIPNAVPLFYGFN